MREPPFFYIYKGIQTRKAVKHADWFSFLTWIRYYWNAVSLLRSKMTIGKKELNLRLAPETFGRNAALDPAQIRSRAVYFFLFLKERKFTGGWVLFRLCTSALHIKVTGFEPMALCTQNRCADQTALHLVSPPSAYRSTRSMKTRTELAHPFGHRDARTNPSNQPLFLENLPPDRATPKSRIVQERSHFFASSFTWIKKNTARATCPLDPKPA